MSASASPVVQRRGVYVLLQSVPAAPAVMQLKREPAIDAVLGIPDATTAKALATDPKALQDSLTLSPSVIQNTDNGQNPPVTGQSPADTSKNNFANICALTLPPGPAHQRAANHDWILQPHPDRPHPRRQQNAVFQVPEPQEPRHHRLRPNLHHCPPSAGHAARHVHHAQKTYFANPQKLNADGQIIGHTHIVVEAMDSLTSTKTTDPKRFVFFKGVNTPQDKNRNVQVDVNGGLKPGVYRMCTITSSHTHQPAIVPIAQHGSLDDCVYFTATPGGVKAAEAAGAQTATTKTAATPAKATPAVKKAGGK
ncbi:hypothetical protein B0H14DRAFT_3128154 [Mycena olivaceomarginata]|nr:hypothetical protein B0H14DRAFT_3128154 [Mycena olivaceomarginata]